MGKSHGLGARFYLGGSNLSGDIASLSRIGGGPAALDLTDITQEAFERRGGIFDGSMSVTTWFNDAAGRSHPVLGALPTTARIATYCHRATIGSPAASLSAKQYNYDPTRSPDGSLSSNVEAAGCNGSPLEWGVLLTAASRTDTGATNGAGVDQGAAGTFGLQAYLQVESFSGTDVTVKLQESSDDAATDAYVDVTGGAFTQITGGAPLSERIATATNLAVERYLRVATVTTGGFSSLVFAVMVVVNRTAPTF